MGIEFVDNMLDELLGEVLHEVWDEGKKDEGVHVPAPRCRGVSPHQSCHALP
jgi:hypothetical protein